MSRKDDGNYEDAAKDDEHNYDENGDVEVCCTEVYVLKLLSEFKNE